MTILAHHQPIRSTGCHTHRFTFTFYVRLLIYELGFTVLLQDDVGGLEVLNANANWVPAPPIPGTFVVNVGDFLMRTTNDRFLSTVHRVKNVSARDRYSMPFFFCFNMDAYVEVSDDSGGSHDRIWHAHYVQVLPSCCTAESPSKYEPITVSDVSHPRNYNPSAARLKWLTTPTSTIKCAMRNRDTISPSGNQRKPIPRHIASYNANHLNRKQHQFDGPEE